MMDASGWKALIVAAQQQQQHNFNNGNASTPSIGTSTASSINWRSSHARGSTSSRSSAPVAGRGDVTTTTESFASAAVTGRGDFTTDNFRPILADPSLGGARTTTHNNTTTRNNTNSELQSFTSAVCGPSRPPLRALPLALQQQLRAPSRRPLSALSHRPTPAEPIIVDVDPTESTGVTLPHTNSPVPLSNSTSAATSSSNSAATTSPKNKRLKEPFHYGRLKDYGKGRSLPNEPEATNHSVATADSEQATRSNKNSVAAFAFHGRSLPDEPEAINHSVATADSEQATRSNTNSNSNRSINNNVDVRGALFLLKCWAFLTGTTASPGEITASSSSSSSSVHRQLFSATELDEFHAELDEISRLSAFSSVAGPVPVPALDQQASPQQQECNYQEDLDDIDIFDILRAEELSFAQKILFELNLHESYRCAFGDDQQLALIPIREDQTCNVDTDSHPTHNNSSNNNNVFVERIRGGGPNATLPQSRRDCDDTDSGDDSDSDSDDDSDSDSDDDSFNEEGVDEFYDCEPIEVIEEENVHPNPLPSHNFTNAYTCNGCEGCEGCLPARASVEKKWKDKVTNAGPLSTEEQTTMTLARTPAEGYYFVAFERTLASKKRPKGSHKIIPMPIALCPTNGNMADLSCGGYDCKGSSTPTMKVMKSMTSAFPSSIHGLEEEEVQEFFGELCGVCVNIHPTCRHPCGKYRRCPKCNPIAAGRLATLLNWVFKSWKSHGYLALPIVLAGTTVGAEQVVKLIDPSLVAGVIDGLNHPSVYDSPKPGYHGFNHQTECVTRKLASAEEEINKVLSQQGRKEKVTLVATLSVDCLFVETDMSKKKEKHGLLKQRLAERGIQMYKDKIGIHDPNVPEELRRAWCAKGGATTVEREAGIHDPNVPEELRRAWCAKGGATTVEREAGIHDPNVPEELRRAWCAKGGAKGGATTVEREAGIYDAKYSKKDRQAWGSKGGSTTKKRQTGVFGPEFEKGSKRAKKRAVKADATNKANGTGIYSITTKQNQDSHYSEWVMNNAIFYPGDKGPRFQCKKCGDIFNSRYCIFTKSKNKKNDSPVMTAVASLCAKVKGGGKQCQGGPKRYGHHFPFLSSSQSAKTAVVGRNGINPSRTLCTPTPAERKDHFNKVAESLKSVPDSILAPATTSKKNKAVRDATNTRSSRNKETVQCLESDEEEDKDLLGSILAPATANKKINAVRDTTNTRASRETCIRSSRAKKRNYSTFFENDNEDGEEEDEDKVWIVEADKENKMKVQSNSKKKRKKPKRTASKAQSGTTLEDAIEIDG